MKRWECAACDEFFRPDEVSSAAPPESAGVDLAGLPFSVGYPLARGVRAGEQAGRRLDNLLFAAYQAMRTAGLLLLADYLASPAESPAAARAIRGLRMPHWGEWTRLCDTLAKVLREPQAGAAYPALATRWDAVAGRGARPEAWGPLARALHPESYGLNNALQRFRNDRAHRQATRVDEESAEAVRALQAVVEALVGHLFPKGEVKLLRRVRAGGGDRAVCLRGTGGEGPHPEFDTVPLEEGWRQAFAESDVVAVTPGGALSVYPLFVAADAESRQHALGAGGYVEPLALVDGASERRVVLLGVRGYQETKQLVEPFLGLLKRKRVDFGLGREETTPWTLAEWAAATARSQLEDFRGRKYFPECYVERAGVDGWVEDALQRPGRALLVLGEAGSGKSSLLARTVERLLEAGVAEGVAPGSQQDVLLFLSGRADYAGDAGAPAARVLCDAVCRKAGVRAGSFDTLEDLLQHLTAAGKDDEVRGRRVVLVLDALNEADRFTDLVAVLDALLPAAQRFPWMRLVLSMRSGAYHSLARKHVELGYHGAVVFENEGHLIHFDDPRRPGETRSYLEVRPFLPHEGRSAYDRWQQGKSERSCTTPWDRLPRNLQTVLLSPLHLQVFHSAFAGREVPGPLGEVELLEQYLDKLARDLPLLGKQLPEIGRLMYDRRIAELPFEVASDWVAAWRSTSGASQAIAKLDPVEELVAASLLMRMGSDGVFERPSGFVFSHQKLSEVVLHRELRRQIGESNEPTGQDLLRWGTHASPAPGGFAFQELIAAIARAAAQCLQRGAGDQLKHVLALEDARVARRVVGQALLDAAFEARWENSEAALRLGIDRLVASAHDVANAARLLAATDDVATTLGEWGFSSLSAHLHRARVVLARRIAAEGSAGELSNAVNAIVAATTWVAFVDGTSPALELAREAWSLCDHFRGDESPELLASRVGALERLADMLEQRGDLGEAHLKWVDCVEAARRAVAAPGSGASSKSALALALSGLGRVRSELGQTGPGEDALREAMEVYEALLLREPNSPTITRALGAVLIFWSRSRVRSGDRDAALALARRCVNLDRQLVDAWPQSTELRVLLSYALEDVAALTGQVESRQILDEVLTIRRGLVEEDEQNLEYGRLLASALLGIVEANQRSGGTVADGAAIDEAVRRLRQLYERDPLSRDLRDMLERAERIRRAHGRAPPH